MNKKKALPRKSYSVERTLKDLIDEIGYEGIEIATGKKKSSIQNISNPTYKERQLSHQDAMDLDVYCRKMGLGTPFLTAYETLVKKYTADKKDHDSTEEIITNLLKIGESIGDVMEETRKALKDDKVDDVEKEKIATQNEFLKKIGILERANIISKKMTFKEKANMFYRLKRLLGRNEMRLICGSFGEISGLQKYPIRFSWNQTRITQGQITS